MTDSIELDFLAVETKKSGDAIGVRYSINQATSIHVVDGGYLETGDRLVEHLQAHYGTNVIDHVVLTHPDADHVNGLRRVLERCTVGTLWMNRPWIYAGELIHRFETYNSVDALRRKLRDIYCASAALEELAIQKGILIKEAFQGGSIGAFTILAPSRSRYLDLVVESERTPEAVERSVFDAAIDGITTVLAAAKRLLKGAWGQELFPASGTSSENEMSVVQTVVINGKRVLLTGDVGREGLAEAADYLESIGGVLPGVWAFQVPHHGGRHNVDTEILDRWVGSRLATAPDTHSWSAICSSAKADADHPRKVVVRAMIHRGAHFAATEGNNLYLANGVSRAGWSAVPQAPYPDEFEED
ncbi:ComEC/Rec2 family competence protein [Xanthomonas arboricola]|uniref:ComEC/Rec2 family competence protein n=1 Tax=Xanthomonas arboricola TaxID=56448 RepID=UPI002B29AB51|nr:MBL fold metallo-hydrolase [Xanthomonas arboricola]